MFPREASPVKVRSTPSRLDSVVPGVDLEVPAGYLDRVDSVSGTGQGEGLRG